MKKLTLFITLCMLLTVGGVYATWTYATVEQVDSVSETMSVALTDKTVTGKEGTYTVDCSNVSLTIDPKTGTTHTTALSVTGDIVITFTPNTYASETVKNNAVSSQYALSLSENWKYDNADILSLTTAGGQAHEITWSKQTNGTFTCTIAASTLAGYLNLTEVTLDTVAKYEVYTTALNNGQITLTVSDTRTFN